MGEMGEMGCEAFHVCRSDAPKLWQFFGSSDLSFYHLSLGCFDLVSLYWVLAYDPSSPLLTILRIAPLSSRDTSA